MSTDLTESTGVTNPLILIDKMIDKGAPPEQLEKWLDMAERWERNKAAERYATAITAFQKRMGPIIKANPVKNKAGQLIYYFADFCDVMDVVQPLASECGIVITFDTEPQDKRIKVTCNIRVGIHVEHSHAYVSVPGIPNANDTQMDGGAISFGKRYAVCAGLGIRIKGEDNDARTVDAPLDPTQVAVINELFEDCERAGDPVQMQKFWDWIHHEDGTQKSMNEMMAKDFARAVDFLTRKRRKAGKK